MAKRAAAQATWADLALALPKAKRSALDHKPFPLQLAKLSASPPAGKGWLHEIKWDGYRLAVTVVGGKARLWSRNGLDWTARVPSLVRAIERLGPDEMALDGEMIAGRGTQNDFNLLQATLAGGRSPKAGAVSLVVFDLLHLEGVDVSQAPLSQRKELLAQLLTSPPAGLAYSNHVAGDGGDAFEAAAAAGFEGVISKKAGAGYHGGRGEDWRKIKHLPSHEYAVVGWMPGQGSRGSGVGSLLLATPDSAHGWSYIGRVGSGFTDELLRQLNRAFKGHGQAAPTVHVPEGKGKDLRQARWLEPSFVAEVYVRGTSGGGFLRQPSLKGLRPDKDPQDLL